MVIFFVISGALSSLPKLCLETGRGEEILNFPLFKSSFVFLVGLLVGE